jgi:2-C-methyl-D-erythritol 4-phosphate cytidylyltransferase
MKSLSQKSVIIVAGGTGKRMGRDIPKQFIEIGGKPVLMHTLHRFFIFDPEILIILVLPFEHIAKWNLLCSQHRFLIPHQVVAGGSERYDSVKNGLEKIGDNCLVAIHDGVRPLVSIETISKSYELACIYGSAVPSVLVKESLREVVEGQNRPVDRRNFYLIQTPQTFKSSLIRKAYQKPFNPLFTDDASVFEAAGNEVHLFEGNAENIKITTPADLKIAEALLNEGI